MLLTQVPKSLVSVPNRRSVSMSRSESGPRLSAEGAGHVRGASVGVGLALVVFLGCGTAGRDTGGSGGRAEGTGGTKGAGGVIGGMGGVSAGGRGATGPGGAGRGDRWDRWGFGNRWCRGERAAWAVAPPAVGQEARSPS